MPRVFTSFILISLTLALGVIFLWPKYQEFDNLQIEIKNKELEIQYQEEYYQKIILLSETIEKEYQQEILKINSAFPSDPQLPSLLRFLQKTASENGLILTKVGSFSIKALPENARIKEIQTTLELSGSYPALKNFLKALEKSARIIEVDNISLSVSPKKEREISEIFTFQLSIKTKSY